LGFGAWVSMAFVFRGLGWDDCLYSGHGRERRFFGLALGMTGWVRGEVTVLALVHWGYCGGAGSVDTFR
jgi:hypothetical protein